MFAFFCSPFCVLQLRTFLSSPLLRKLICDPLCGTCSAASEIRSSCILHSLFAIAYSRASRCGSFRYSRHSLPFVFGSLGHASVDTEKELWRRSCHAIEASEELYLAISFSCLVLCRARLCTAFIYHVRVESSELSFAPPPPRLPQSAVFLRRLVFRSCNLYSTPAFAPPHPSAHRSISRTTPVSTTSAVESFDRGFPPPHLHCLCSWRDLCCVERVRFCFEP